MTTQPGLDEVHRTIDAKHQQWLSTFSQEDAAGVAAIYAEEGRIMPAYSTAITGRAAIQAFWQGCFDMGICTMLRKTHAIDWLVDTVNEVGEYRFLDRHDRILDVGKYVIIWKWKAEQWHIQCDIWTSNLPAP
jgi:ketosteroid isomerase-like protein